MHYDSSPEDLDSLADALYLDSSYDSSPEDLDSLADALYRELDITSETNNIFREGMRGDTPHLKERFHGARNFARRIGSVALSFREDWKEGTSYSRSIQALAVAGQITERLRLSEFLLVPAAVGILRASGSPSVTAASVLGMVEVSQSIISHSWAEAMDKSPKTIENINTSFPGLVSLAEDLGGSRDKKWYSHVREGAASFFTYGVTPFVVAEKIQNPEISRTKLHTEAALMTGKCALFGCGLTLAIGETLTHVGEDAASTVMRYIGNPLVWMGVAAAFEVPRLVGKRYTRMKAKKLQKMEASTNEA